MKTSMRELSEREVSQVSGAGVLGGVVQGIVFAAEEMAPWTKTGALGDVLQGLPSAVDTLGQDLGKVIEDLL